MDLLIGGNWSSFFRIGSGSQQKTRHVMEVVSLASLLLVATCIAVGVWILIAIAGSGPILALERVAMESLSDREAEPLVAKVMTSGQFDPQWLATTGFKPKGAYRIVKLPGVAGIVAWKKEGEATYLCAYLLTTGDVGIDFVTVCDGAMLTTGKSKDGHLLPSPQGHYLQTFSATTAVLYRRHQGGLKILGKIKNIVPSTSPSVLENIFATAVHQQSRCVRSHLLWPLRIPWWYFTRRSLRHDKSLAQLDAFT